MDACSPAGFNHRPVRQFGCRYSFCREVGNTQDASYEWDDDGRLSQLLFLSRLIHPTSIGTLYAAKLYFRDGELKTIVPGPVQGFGIHAWVVADWTYRDWLSVAELNTLKALMPRYSLHPPDRVRQARRHIDHAFHSYHLDQRYASLVTAFESLLQTSHERLVKQFEIRVPKLAELFSQQITKKQASSLYGDRSAFVHGTRVSFDELTPEVIGFYSLFEGVLRACLLRASTELTFAETFGSTAKIEEAFGTIPPPDPLSLPLPTSS